MNRRRPIYFSEPQCGARILRASGYACCRAGVGHPPGQHRANGGIEAGEWFEAPPQTYLDTEDPRIVTETRGAWTIALERRSLGPWEVFIALVYHHDGVEAYRTVDHGTTFGALAEGREFVEAVETMRLRPIGGAQ